LGFDPYFPSEVHRRDRIALLLFSGHRILQMSTLVPRDQYTTMSVVSDLER
jgi:hypothetical protein